MYFEKKQKIDKIHCTSIKGFHSIGNRYGDHTLKNPRVEPAMKQLDDDFSNLLDRLLQVLSDKQISVGELKVYLMRLCADEREIIYYFDQKMLKIDICTTCKNVFAFLTEIGVWTFLHYHLVEAIIEEFQLGCDAVIAEYEKKVSTFMEDTLLQDFLIVWNRSYAPPTPKEYDLVILKVKGSAKWSTYTLAQAAEARGYLAREFKLRKLVLNIHDGVEGSVYIMWLVPISVGEYMRRRMNEPDWPKQLSCDFEELRIERKVSIKPLLLYKFAFIITRSIKLIIVL